MLSDIGEAGQEKLQQASVLIVGVGGLGSPISLYLTGCGVGRIGIVDGDTVDESNLHRQVVYSEREIGQSKTFTAAEHLRSLNSNVQIDTYDTRLTEANAEEIIGRYDVIVDGTDNADARYLIDATCAKLAKPYVYGAVCEYTGQVSVFNYNGGGRYSDLFPKASTQAKVYGLFGVLPGVIGSLEANEVIKIITGVGEVLSGKLFTINLLTLRTHILQC
jgi:adenylyltransferase/sulfurtransferase